MDHTIFFLFDVGGMGVDEEQIIHSKLKAISFNGNTKLIYLKKNKGVAKDAVVEFSIYKNGEIILRDCNFMNKQQLVYLLNSFYNPSTKFYLINCIHGSGFGYGDCGVNSAHEQQLYAHYFEGIFFKFEFVVQNICYSAGIEDLYYWSLKTDNIIASPYLTSIQFADVGHWIEIILAQQPNMFDEIYDSYIKSSITEHTEISPLLPASSICKFDLRKIDFSAITSAFKTAALILKEKNDTEWIQIYYAQRKFIDTNTTQQFYALTDVLNVIPTDLLSDNTNKRLKKQRQYLKSATGWWTPDNSNHLLKISATLYMPRKKTKSLYTYYNLFWKSMEHPSELSISLNEFYEYLPIFK